MLCPCHIIEEWVHLFFDCKFNRRVWTQDDNIERMFIAARNTFSKPFFAEVVILACWHIWKQRNGAIFQKVKPSFRAWPIRYIHEATLHVHIWLRISVLIFSSPGLKAESAWILHVWFW
jgi:hypothetical protein